MARIRSIKPEFFTNDEIALLDPLTRLLFIGLWTQADRDGRMVDRPRRLKAVLMPYDECDIDAMLDALCASGHIMRYELAGQRYIQVLNFRKHQSPHLKENPSTIPAPDLHGASPQEGRGEEWKGRESTREADSSTDKPGASFASFPPCLEAPVTLDGKTASGMAHILRTGEELYGPDWAASSKRNALAAMICDGCLTGCDGRPAQAEECACHVIEKMVLKHKGTWEKSRALLRTCIVNDREQVRV